MNDDEPRGVLCSNPECPLWEDNPEAFPVWDHDCPVREGVLVCQACGSPVVHPPRGMSSGRPRDQSGWEQVRELALAQQGFFTETQAGECGLTPLLLRQLLRRNWIEPVRGRIYRLGGSEPSPFEPAVLAWLWSGREGVVSHETALALHGLAEPSASEVHLTLRPDNPRRYNRPPGAIHLHIEHLPPEEVEQVQGLPALCLERTLAQTLRNLPRARIRQILEEVAERLFRERDPAAPDS